MTQAELLNWLSSQDFCNAILDTPQAIGEPQSDGTQWYAVTIREVYENSAITRRIHFYIVNKETSEEIAYWKDAIPVATLQPVEPMQMYKMITFRTLIHQLDNAVATAMIEKLKAAVSQNVIIEQAYKMLETYGPDGGIDINSRNTQIMIQSLVTSNILTQAEADTVIALADTDLRTTAAE
ncbi:MAG: hypothetical protein PHE53_12875 [Thermoguttaceae bacterium]|nr:hypothetical protein [Thermoguttaceae bacterium]